MRNRHGPPAPGSAAVANSALRSGGGGRDLQDQPREQGREERCCGGREGRSQGEAGEAQKEVRCWVGEAGSHPAGAGAGPAVLAGLDPNAARADVAHRGRRQPPAAPGTGVAAAAVGTCGPRAVPPLLLLLLLLLLLICNRGRRRRRWRSEVDLGEAGLEAAREAAVADLQRQRRGVEVGWGGCKGAERGIEG